jgi:hypothetical protein
MHSEWNELMNLSICYEKQNWLEFDVLTDVVMMNFSSGI